MKSTLGLTCLLALALVTRAHAAGGEASGADGPASTLELDYQLFAGGVPLGSVSMSARIQGRDYRAVSSIETRGIVNRFWRSKIDASTSGVLTGDRLVPSVYDSYSLRRRTGDRRHVTLTFDPDGPKAMEADPPYENNAHPVSDDAKRQALDPLSAAIFVLSGLSADSENPCGVVAPVFDGRRRYDVGMSFVKTADIRMENGLYQGPGLVCQVHYRQVAGYDQEVIDQNRRWPDILAWVVPVQSKTEGSRRYLVPLRIWTETDYGLVVALASQVKLDGGGLREASLSTGVNTSRRRM